MSVDLRKRLTSKAQARGLITSSAIAELDRPSRVAAAICWAFACDLGRPSSLDQEPEDDATLSEQGRGGDHGDSLNI